MHASYLKNLEKFEKTINYTFKDKSLLKEALTHSSYANEHQKEGIRDNERLEFLGDAVLGLSVVETLFRAEDLLSESEMARLKSFLVSKSVLSEIARELSIGDFLLLGKGEERSGGREKENILSDAMEAVFGAIYIDGGFNKAKRVVLKLLDKHIKKTLKTREAHDFKTVLQEFTQEKFALLPEYTVVKEEGLEHQKTYVVEVTIKGKKMGKGRGRSKKEAQMMAAKEALERLRKGEKPS